MPQNNHTIHNPLIINPKAFAYVQALTDIDSPTFGNQYRSALKAGYSHYYARVIGHYFPKWRIKKTLTDMEDPLAQALVEEITRINASDISPGPSRREEKRTQAVANRKFKEVKDELDAILGPIEY